jgi:hypothetical protein
LLGGGGNAAFESQFPELTSTNEVRIAVYEVAFLVAS